MDASIIRTLLESNADPERAEQQQRFFKTGPGDYAEGDVFWGLGTPWVRTVVRVGVGLPLLEVERLLEDPVHEVRACGLMILVAIFSKVSGATRKEIIDLYLRSTDRINNWDLVDISAPMLGHWVSDKDRSLLYTLSASHNLWEQRIAIVATLPLIKQRDYTDILQLTETLYHHRHDLIHKALGWMLREVGKQDKPVLEEFLDRYAGSLPRTTLRYAIERFPSEERAIWMRRERSAPVSR